jgi:hypothetical protein
MVRSQRVPRSRPVEVTAGTATLWRFRSNTDLENANLPQRRLPDLLVLVRLLELFDRHDLPRLAVAALEDHAVRPARRKKESKGVRVWRL